jgi:predicted RNA-binding protein with PIN domain
MSLHLIIDGYNLLAVLDRASGRIPLHSEMARESLIQELGAYRHRKAHPVTIVFDGWQQGFVTERREHRSGIEVIYSRRGEKADQVIQRMAAEFGSDCAVVSSDREVVNHAKAQGALVLGASEFSAKLRGGASPGRTAFKELDTGDDPKPVRSSDKRGNPRKLPKAQRQRNRQLKRF